MVDQLLAQTCLEKLGVVQVLNGLREVLCERGGVSVEQVLPGGF